MSRTGADSSVGGSKLSSRLKDPTPTDRQRGTVHSTDPTVKRGQNPESNFMEMINADNQ
jgi:hypothetical protein